MAVPSSVSNGFFQVLPNIQPKYTLPLPTSDVKADLAKAKRLSDDKVFARLLALYLPANGADQVTRSVHDFSRQVIHPSVLRHSVDAEVNQPRTSSLTTFGEENRRDPLWTTEGWKALKAIGIEQGVVSHGYATENVKWNRRIQQYAKIHVWAVASVVTLCPMSMSDGAATLLSKHLDDEDGDQVGRRSVLREAYSRVISSDPKRAWTSGQWMTERTGGSDVSKTETLARRLTPDELASESRLGRRVDSIGMPLGPWRIDGFKWFSSATDSDMAMLLARTEKGLSVFFAPTRRRVADTADDCSELNGIRISRLKNKLGTKGLPTAELELHNMRAWLIGEEGNGIKEIAALINITRTTNSARNASYWSHSLAVCRAYANVRKIRGGLLRENQQHLRWMAQETVDYTGAMHLAWFGVALLGTSEQGRQTAASGTQAERLIPEDPVHITALLRLITPLAKGQVCLRSVAGIRACMESLGGVGYCENNEDGGLLNIARIWRDAAVGPIWEGTTSIMAEDVVRVLFDKKLGYGDVLNNVLRPWIESICTVCESLFKDECTVVKAAWCSLALPIAKATKDALYWRGRNLLEQFEGIIVACLLMFDACTDSEDVTILVARRWVQNRFSQQTDLLHKELDLGREKYHDSMIFLGAAPSPKLHGAKL